MTFPPGKAILATLAVAAIAAASAFAAVPVYQNELATQAERSQIRQTGAGKCKRGAGGEALQVVVGEGTTQCAFRTPVVGRDLEIAATGRLLASTPADLQGRVFLSLSLRNGSNGQYLLAVFPKRGSWLLRRDAPTDGARTVLAQGRSGAVKGVGKLNKLRLRAFNGSGGEARLAAYANNKRLGSVADAATEAAKLTGRVTAFGIGSDQGAKGAAASFTDLRVQVPDPF